MKSYLNDAIIGNKELKIGLDCKGEALRIRYPNVDYREFIDFLYMGVKINDSNIIYLHNDTNNVYFQEYIEDTNILKTEVKNMYFNLRVQQIDFVPINKSVFIRKYVLSNEHEIPLDVKFLAHTRMLTDTNNFIGSRVIDNGILGYSHDFNMAILSNDLKVNGYKIHGADEAMYSGVLYDKDYVGMSNDFAISYDVGVLNPNENKEFSIMIVVRR